MTEFIRNNPLTTAHIATEVVVLGGLLYYSFQINKNLSKSVIALERRLATCERTLASVQQQQRPSSHHKPPVHRASHHATHRTQHHPPTTYPPSRSQRSPSPSPPLTRNIITTSYDGDYVKLSQAKQLDQEIEEELNKLVDFASKPITVDGVEEEVVELTEIEDENAMEHVDWVLFDN